VLENPVAAYRLTGRILVLLAFLGALALVPARVAAQTVCSAAPTALCLQGSRFQAEVTWTAPGFGSGTGQAVPLTGDTGYFWFFSSSNVELVVKVLDGRAVNRHFWVFYGALSDVGYTLTITDLQTGAREVFTNPQGRLASVADITAFNTAFNPEPPPNASRAASPAASVGSIRPKPELPVRLGPEFQANAVSAGDQSQPAVAMAPDGSFMVAWVSGKDVFGRIFDAAGAPRTGDVRLNDVALGSFAQVRVAANAAGGFMAVWSDGGPAFGSKSALARVYGPDGHPLGGVIPLAAGNDAGFPFVSLPDVTADPAGGFLAAWTEYGNVGSTFLVTQRFDAQGRQLGSQVPFDAHGSIGEPRVAASPRGGFLVVWAATFPQIDAPISDLWAQPLDASGQTVGGSFVINSEIRPLPGAVRLGAPVFYADGSFAVLWSQTTLFGFPSDGLYARRYTAAGTPAGGITAIQSHPPASFSAPSALALPLGDTWVVWSDQVALGTVQAGIYSGVFGFAWDPEGEIRRVNTYVSPWSAQAGPAVAAAGNHAVAVWDSNSLPLPTFPPPVSQDGSGSGVFGQRFSLVSCALDANELCLDGRFRISVQFTDPRNGQTSAGTPVPITGDTGAFWFFDRPNLELMIKVLDGRAANGHFWVFYGALSDVSYTIGVTDTVTGISRTYHNNLGHLASGSDVTAF